MAQLPASPGSRSTLGLPAFERLAPPPSSALVAAHLESASRPGEIVLELHGRGGWIARESLRRLRRVCSFESIGLTRLLAEIVLAPPDLVHFDAGRSALAVQPRGPRTLREAINESFSSRCAVCGEAVVVDEFLWRARETAPDRKTYRCPTCTQRDGTAWRTAAIDERDAERARAVVSIPARDRLRSRFTAPPGSELPEQLLELYSPRTVVALDAILERIEQGPRDPSIDAALRLALLHVVTPASRLDRDPQPPVTLRIVQGSLGDPAPAAWRERNPWVAFEASCALLRELIGALHRQSETGAHPRLGVDVGDLADASASVVLGFGDPALPENDAILRPRRRTWGRGLVRPGPTGEPVARVAGDDRLRIPLVLSQPPLRWSEENLSLAYLGTALCLGRAALDFLPLERLFEPVSTSDWDVQARALGSSLRGVRDVLRSDARVILMLDPSGNEGVVAGALAAADAGYRIVSAPLGGSEAGEGGALELRPADAAGGLSGPTTDEPSIPASVTEIAVEALQARGEPVGFERLLSEVLVGLDGRGQLRALAKSSPDAPGGVAAAGAEDRVGRAHRTVTGELRRPDHARIYEIEQGRWWLRRQADANVAQPPLSDRVEWAVFSLLATSGGITEPALMERIGRMFHGLDTPDEGVVRACLASYVAETSERGLLRTNDDLQRRHAEHTELIALLVDYGHRLGLRCWVSEHEQQRRYAGQLVADLLTPREQGVALRSLALGDLAALQATDCIWYLRGRATFLFEVEWTAMVGEPVLRRGPRIVNDETLVRFLVVLPERAELLRFKIDRSIVLRGALQNDNWHILKADNLRALARLEDVDLHDLQPYLGLDASGERRGEPLPLFA